ncbi:hypothetical protein SKDZ_03G0920 [Saccharomyces kudriavzevii ZP591]|uniref:TLC domain-containing protein n=2 Tax=Saccharomyces TaxID=4930 RepID=A0AA35JCQ3_SACK1|nr:uncharacterized protein SKDI_03G0940 [Saccharomyces kudriavzevii IFO 1802]CAI4056656.1 hypothetical protein SKDZ_03G0920 [Saccharomyces kudriavzevii ZP591]CAI4056669.1 hypothetical protein SKDI_03G0940 [Saccharomyces kudriavzevii IFO 1802]
MSTLEPKSSSSDLKLRTRPRRRSSIWRINLGETVPSFGTMSETKESKTAAEIRMRRLSEAAKGDGDLVKKIWFSFREISYRHAWIAPSLILIAVYSAYFASGNTTKTNVLHRFVAVSYQVGDTNAYGKGINDLCFVFYYMIFFTFLRELLMDVVIRPFAIWLHVTSRHRIVRIMEQMYAVFYTGVSGPFGIYCMYHSDVWFFDTEAMYKTYPDLTNPLLLKVFYLGQAAFWAQQACILVLQLEKPRKDHKELIFHHIVTLLLIWSSYVFHFTKMGLPVFITMDVSDFLFSLSKTLNYLDSNLASPTFFIFVMTWIYLRHYINLRILWSVLTQFRTEGNYVLNFATQQYKCWISLPIVFVLIGALQLVNLYWLFLIFRVLFRIIWKGVAKDDRSDSESDEENDGSLKQA